MKTTIKTADGKELTAVQLEQKQVTNAVGETVTITRSFVPMPAEMQAALNSLPEDERHEAMMQYMVDQGAIDADVAELYDLDPVPEGWVPFEEAVRSVNAGEYPELSKAVGITAGQPTTLGRKARMIVGDELQGDRPLTRQDTFDVQEICNGLRQKSDRNRRRAIKKAYNKLQKKGRLK